MIHILRVTAFNFVKSFTRSTVKLHAVEPGSAILITLHIKSDNKEKSLRGEIYR